MIVFYILCYNLFIVLRNNDIPRGKHKNSQKKSFCSIAETWGNILIWLAGVIVIIAVLVIYFIISSASLALLLFLELIMVFLNDLFFHLLKAPTLAGRKVLDQIDGFRQYMDVAEKDDISRLNPPEKTIEIFEKFLPYAIAFDMEKNWGSIFQ